MYKNVSPLFNLNDLDEKYIRETCLANNHRGED